MQKDPQRGWNRREFVNATALVALALGVPSAAVSLTQLDSEDAPSDRQSLIMKHVSQLVIPRSATPGAGDVGAGDFAILALAHGLDRSRTPLKDPGAFARFVRNDGSVRHVAWLERELDARSGGNFLKASDEQRFAVLKALDAEAFASRESESPWKAIKGLIVTGYYTSEVGAAHELRYEPVPGRFDPDLPLTPDFRAISNDWTAVDFG